MGGLCESTLIGIVIWIDKVELDAMARGAKGNTALAEAYRDLLTGLPLLREEVKRRTNGPGRPSIYSDALVETICQRMADGETVTDICSDAGMPGVQTISTWKRVNPDFGERYAHARQDLADWHANEALRVAQLATPDTVQVDRLRYDSHKWYAEKMNPGLYGVPKQQIELTGTVTLASMVESSLKALEARTIEAESIDVTPIETDKEGNPTQEGLFKVMRRHETTV